MAKKIRGSASADEWLEPTHSTTCMPSPRIAATCSSTAVIRSLVDIRTGKTCMRGCEAVFDHLRTLGDAPLCAAEIAAMERA